MGYAIAFIAGYAVAAFQPRFFPLIRKAVGAVKAWLNKPPQE